MCYPKICSRLNAHHELDAFEWFFHLFHLFESRFSRIEVFGSSTNPMGVEFLCALGINGDSKFVQCLKHFVCNYFWISKKLAWVSSRFLANFHSVCFFVQIVELQCEMRFSGLGSEFPEEAEDANLQLPIEGWK